MESDSHTVEITEFYCMSRFFRKNSVNSPFLLKNFTVNWFDGKNLYGREFFLFSTVQCDSHQDKIRENDLVLKGLISRNFCYSYIWKRDNKKKE